MYNRRSYATLDETGALRAEQLPVAAAAAPQGPHQHTESDVTNLTSNLAGKAPTHAHPYEPSGAVSTHAQTAHGLSAHALDGAFHSNTGLLPTQGQKNALAGTSGTPGTGNEFVTTQDARNTNARTPTAHGHVEVDVTGLVADLAAKAPSVHSHAYEPSGAVSAHEVASNPHPTYATDGDLTAHAATPHGAPLFATLANGAVAMGFGTNTTVKVTPTANATYTSTVPAAGSVRVLLILTSGTTSRTITFGTGFKTVGTLVTGTVTARVFAISFVSDGTNLYETGRTAAMAA